MPFNIRGKTKKAARTVKRKFENLFYKLKYALATNKKRANQGMLEKRFEQLKKRHEENNPINIFHEMGPLVIIPGHENSVRKKIQNIEEEIQRQINHLNTKKIKESNQSKKNFIQDRIELMKNNMKRLKDAKKSVNIGLYSIPKSIGRKYGIKWNSQTFRSPKNNIVLPVPALAETVSEKAAKEMKERAERTIQKLNEKSTLKYKHSIPGHLHISKKNRKAFFASIEPQLRNLDRVQESLQEKRKTKQRILNKTLKQLNHKNLENPLAIKSLERLKKSLKEQVEMYNANLKQVEKNVQTLKNGKTINNFRNYILHSSTMENVD